MPRDLGDVLHYFMPEATPGSDASLARVDEKARPRRAVPTALPMVAVPIGHCDVVRAALMWNLAFEIDRLGGRSALVVPAQDSASALWPQTDTHSLATRVVVTGARTLAELYRDALDIAVSCAADPIEGGIVLVRVPPEWLSESAGAGRLLRWSLLFSSSDSRELLETYGIGKLLLSADPGAKVGVTIHGARRMSEARDAFSRLARSTERHLERELLSYGLLVDDLDVYRAIVAQRPIGLAHPQSAAARALRDVAGLLLEDARKVAIA